ncbi:MAG: hypothetical protein PHP85_11305 [Gallionella sp.]|nr:hypothetical protein [Gallionella sp.]
MSTASLIGKISIRVISLYLLVNSVQAEPVVFESTDTPPYWSATLPGDGLGGSILKLLSDAAGIEYTIAYLPVKRYRQSVAAYIVGDPDMLIDQRHRAIFPFGLFRSAFFYYKPQHDVIEFRTLRELRGHTLGVLRGTLEDKDYFVRNGIKVEESDSVESLIRKLRRGRIDFCILVEGTGRYAIAQLFPAEQNNFVRVTIAGSVRPIALMIDLDAPGGWENAQRYRQILVKTLHSQQYQRTVAAFYGMDGIPADRQAQLKKFIQYYENTWDQ